MMIKAFMFRIESSCERRLYMNGIVTGTTKEDAEKTLKDVADTLYEDYTFHVLHEILDENHTLIYETVLDEVPNDEEVENGVIKIFGVYIPPTIEQTDETLNKILQLAPLKWFYYTVYTVDAVTKEKNESSHYLVTSRHMYNAGYCITHIFDKRYPEGYIYYGKEILEDVHDLYPNLSTQMKEMENQKDLIYGLLAIQ